MMTAMSKFKMGKPFALFAMSLAVAFMVTACGNKNDSPAPKKVATVPTVNGYKVPTCTGCPSKMAFLDSALGEMTYFGAPALELSLGFFGDPAIIGPITQTGNLIGSISYAGPVAATGRLVVRTPFQACGVPAGTYTVTTSIPGFWNYKYSFGGIELIAKGPTTVRLQLVQGFVNAAIPPVTALGTNTTFPFRINADVRMMGAANLASIPCAQLMY